MYIIIFAGIILFAILYVYSTFSYDFNNGYIDIKWRLIKVIPFNRKTIRIENISDITFNKNITGVAIWGNLIRKKGVIIKLNKGIIKNIYITPDNPDDFIKQVKSKIRQEKKGHI